MFRTHGPLRLCCRPNTFPRNSILLRERKPRVHTNGRAGRLRSECIATLERWHTVPSIAVPGSRNDARVSSKAAVMLPVYSSKAVQCQRRLAPPCVGPMRAEVVQWSVGASLIFFIFFGLVVRPHGCTRDLCRSSCLYSHNNVGTDTLP